MKASVGTENEDEENPVENEIVKDAREAVEEGFLQEERVTEVDSEICFSKLEEAEFPLEKSQEDLENGRDSKNNKSDKKKSSSLKRSSSLTGSSRQNSFKKRLKYQYKERNLADDFTNIFSKLSSFDNCLDNSDTNVKEIIDQISTETNINYHNNESDSNQTCILSEIDSKDNLIGNINQLNQSTLLKKEDVGENTVELSNIETHNSIVDYSEENNPFNQNDCKLSEENQPTFSNVKHFYEQLSKKEENRNNKSKDKVKLKKDSVTDIVHKERQNNVEETTQLLQGNIEETTRLLQGNTGKHDISEISKGKFNDDSLNNSRNIGQDSIHIDTKKVFKDSRSVFENKEKLNSTKDQIQGRPATSLQTQELNFSDLTNDFTKAVKESNTDNNKIKRCKFVDNSVKHLLRNLSFNSRKKLLFIDDDLYGYETSKEEVKSILNRISSHDSSISSKKNVKTLLKDISFHQENTIMDKALKDIEVNFD